MPGHAWVLMAQDGHRDYFESWSPIAVFLHEPTVMERGRALVSWSPDWPDHPWRDYTDKPRVIADFCQVVKVCVA